MQSSHADEASAEGESGAIGGSGGNGLLAGDDSLLGSLNLLKNLSGDNIGGGSDANAVVGEVVEMHAALKSTVLESLGDVLAGNIDALHGGGDDALETELNALVLSFSIQLTQHIKNHD